MIKIKNIKWDVDEENKCYTEYLPTELEVSRTELHAENVNDLNELYDIVADWLSDSYGYCHYGFELEI